MKIIDLLNKIANGEEVPNKIKIDNRFYYEYYENIDYKSKDGTYLFNGYIQINKEDMNMEVEIIEKDKKIEKIEKTFSLDFIYCNLNDTAQEEINKTINSIYDKINEIIDEVNKLKEE